MLLQTALPLVSDHRFLEVYIKLLFDWCSLYFAAGDDYTVIMERVTFQISDTSQDVMVPILPDIILEESVEQFSASLTVPIGEEGVALGTNDMATVQITDDDSKRWLC